VAGALQADELGDVLEVLTENVLLAFREHGHGLSAKLEQSLMSRRVVQYVDRAEANAFFRKKLFRPQATASAGLNEKDVGVTGGFHVESGTRTEQPQAINPPRTFQDAVEPRQAVKALDSSES
jgi:hypothetical protein